MRSDLASRLGATDWDLWPLWGLAPRVDCKNNGLVETNLLSLSYGKIVRREISEAGGLRPGSYETYNVVEPGDVVLRMTDLQNDQRSVRTGFVNERGIITSAYVTVRPNPTLIEPRFLAATLRAYDIKKVFYEMGSGVRQTLKYAELGQLPIPLPPLATQVAIADYLDRELGELDAMINKMERLSKLLVARRAAVIQAETLDTSGRFTRLKFRADVSLGKTVQGLQRRDDEKLVNYVRAASIQPYGLQLDDQRMWMNEAELEKYDLRKDDVLIVEGGAGYGRSVVLAEDMPGWGFQNHVIRVRPSAGSDGRFLNYCVKGQFTAGLINVLVGGATIPALSSDKAKELPVLDIPLTEQRRIADHLDGITGKIDAMLADIAKLRDLLTVRRTALITDVVTGKKRPA